MAATNKRDFRTQDSIEAEEITRNMIEPFLASRNFTVQDDHRDITGTAISQVITAVDPNGKQIRMRVRLCWRWDRQGNKKIASAAQLRARLINDDWNQTLNAIVSRDQVKGVSHALFVQRDENEIIYAGLVPVSELKAIWEKQRDVSAHLIETGKMEHVRKNHAMNGSSPTVWLMDRRTPDAHEVPDVLWNWKGVVDIAKLPAVSTQSTQSVDDTFDDMPSVDYATLGSDNSPRKKTERSYVKRDPKVRKEVIKRANNQCERKGCGDGRDYPGFLDVHHILGVEKSDRVWNCVALCPNCHREAHCAPNSDRINEELLKFASNFKAIAIDHLELE